MADKIAYKIRHIRMADKTWELFKQKKRKSGKSWNIYLIELLKGQGEESLLQE